MYVSSENKTQELIPYMCYNKNERGEKIKWPNKTPERYEHNFYVNTLYEYPKRVKRKQILPYNDKMKKIQF